MKRCTNVMQCMKSHWRGIWLLKPSIIINILFNYIKRLFFYYLRYLHDIRMKFCGFGCWCQNSCGYPRRMRSSDTPLIKTAMAARKLCWSVLPWGAPGEAAGPLACSNHQHLIGEKRRWYGMVRAERNFESAIIPYSCAAILAIIIIN